MPNVYAGEVARGELAIVGLGLEVQREPVVTAVDVPSYVQTRFGNAAPAPGLSALGDLTGPGIDTPITLSTIPGQKFAIPALHEKGEYLLQNIRLAGASGEFLQAAIPNVATIQVADILETKVKVRQLTPEELRERGIFIDDRNYEVYEYTFIFGVDEQTVEIPYPVIIDKRTREIVPALPPAFRMLPYPKLQKPPRFTPPYIEPFDLSTGGPPTTGNEADREPRAGGVSLPAALVVPNGFGVLHQFFAVILQVSNSAPEGSNIRLDSITAGIKSPLTMRVAKQVPAVAIGQPVPVVDERTGATFLVAGAQGSAEWSLEALKAGTHTVDIDVRATYQKPGQEDFALGGRVSTSIVVSDPRFHVNFSHPDVIRKDEKYTAYSFVTNLSNQRQHVELDLSEVPACSSGSSANNVCRYEGSDTVTLDLDAGEMVPVPYKLMSRVTGKVYAAAGAASDEAVSVSIRLTMGVSESGIPLSPATLVMPYHAQFLPSEFVDANMQLLGLGYSLATAPLTKYTALKPRVITTDVFRRAQQIALAGQRIFSTNDAADRRDAFLHLSLDLLGNIERKDRHDVMPELAEWDELRRTEEAGRIAARAMARQLETNAATFVDDMATATAHRSPFLMAYAHGAPVAGNARPYALSIRGLTTQTLLDVPAEAGSGWVRSLAYGELTKFGDSGELALVGRWAEPMRVTVVPASTSFTLHLLYPGDGTTLRTDVEITNARVGVPVTIDVAPNDRTLIINGATATPLVNEVSEPPLRVLGAAQDMHLDGGGHVVSLLFNRPVADDAPWRDRLALTIDVPKANYRVTRRNGATAELQIPAARLQEDGRLLLITFDKTLSRNASYEIDVDAIAAGIVPQIHNDRPAAILTGRVLNGDNTPVASTLVRLLMLNARVKGIGGIAELVQYDVGGSDGRFLFEYVPRDIDSGLLGEYNLLTETEDGRQAMLNGSVRLPGEVHHANLVFLGRGKARGQVRWEDGEPIGNVHVGIGSSLFGGMYGTTADANGFYELDGLPVGPLIFSTVDPDGRLVYATNAIRTAGEVIVQDLVAVRKEGPPPGVATVRVRVLRSDTMQPVAGAAVGVGSTQVPLMTSTTDSQGRAEFRGVPAGLMSIIAADYSITRHSAAVEVELRGDQLLDQDLVLQIADTTTRYAWLEGVVTRDDPSAPSDTTKDQLVPNAVITIQQLPPITANADGTFLYPDIPTTFADRWIQVFDPQTSRSGWFKVPTLVEGSNRMPLRLSSANPYGHGTFRVRLTGGRGEPVAGARVFIPGYPPVNYTNKGGGVYEMSDVRVPRTDVVRAVVDDPNYGEQSVQGNTRVDFDGQIGITDLRLPGIGTIVVKLEMEGGDALGPVALTYAAWDDYMQMMMPKTVVREPDPSTNLVTFTKVPARQDVLLATVRHPGGYAEESVRLLFDGDARSITLRLKTIGNVSGRVLAHDGITPVAGATVRITTRTAVYAPATTKQDGSFLFAAIPADTDFDVVAELRQDGIFRTAIVSGKTPQGGGPVSGLVAVMREQSSVEGQVVDGIDGTPVPLARYWLRELSWPHRSIGTAQDPLHADINGRFIVSNVFTGPYRITAVAPDNQERRGDFQGTLVEEGDVSQRNVKVPVGGAGTGTVSITVVDPLLGFEPVANAEVSLLREGYGFDFTTTNDAGVAYFEQIPVGPSYSAFVYSKQRGRSGRSDAFQVAVNATTSRSVQLEFLGIVSGSVTDPDTDPPNLPVRGQPVTYQGPISLRATTDTSGNFEFTGVPEGNFALQAWELSTQRIANGPPGLFISKLVPEQRNVKLEMERMGTLTVRVHLPNDTGGPGELAPLVEVTAVQCTICNLITPDYPYYRSAQGNPVVFPRMFRRVGYGLEVRELGGESRTIGAGGGFPAGALTHEQVIVLPQSGTVEALVLDGGGNPVADAEVAFTGGRQAVVFTGSDGRASLTGLPFGWYTLQAKKGNVTAAASGELRSRSQPLRLTLNLGTNVTVTGHVEAEEGAGAPSPRTRVLMDVSTRLLAGNLRLETLTDEQGNFAFTGIPVGGTTLSLLYYGPDDTTIGAKPPPRAFPDGTTGSIVLATVKLDATPPRVLSIEPPANATNVSPSSPVTITFSEPLKAEYLTRFHFELADTDSPQELVQSSVFGSIRPDKTYVVTVLPPDPPAGRTHRLKSNMLYRFSIAAGLEDLTGNRLRSPIGTSFTTVNYTEPEIVRIDPPDTQPLGEQVTFRIKFNKAVDANAGAIALELLDGYKGNAVRSISIARNPDPADPTTILVAPIGYAIEESKFYRLTVSGVTDTQSPPNTQKITRVFDYFAFDRTKPVISIVSPAEKLIAGVLYTVTVASDDGDLAYVDWLDAGGTSVARVKTKPYGYSFVAPSNASSFTLQATATDLSNNTSESPVSKTWEVAPNLAPSAIAITNDVTSAYPSGRVNTRVAFEDEGVSVTVALELRGTALDGSPFAQTLGSQKLTRASTAVAFDDALFTWNVPLSLKDGSATVVATVTDSVNNAGSSEAALTILLDQTRPVLVSFLPKAESRYRFGVNGTYTIELKVRDAETGIARAVFTVGGVEVLNGAGTLENGITTFRKDVSVPPKNADTRVPITVTAYDHRGNTFTETREVIYERVDDASLPRAAWITPLDGAVLPSNQAGWLTTLRVRASDDVKVTRVRFESTALAAPIDLTAPVSGDLFEAQAALTLADAPVVIKAIVSDGDPSHDVELPITIEPVIAAPVITGDINITSTNAAQYAGKSLLVRGNVKVYISTPLTLKDLMLVDGAVLSVPEETRLDVTVERLFVDAMSRVDMTAKGWLGGLRTREDNSFTNPGSSGRTAFAPGATSTADGSHGGIGGSSLGLTNVTYGSLTAPADFGAGGGAISPSERGGNGGGALVLRGTRLVVAGIIRADGEVHSSAGAGGSVLLDTRALITGPASRITANGGDAGASLDHDRGGGGGRIAITAERFDRDPETPLLQARGGRNGNNEGADYVDGGAGTIVVNDALVVSSFDERHPATSHRTAGTPLGATDFDSITIGPRALARFDVDVPANVTADPSATIAGPNDLPSVTLLSTTPAANADVPQHTSISASFTATSPTGIRQVRAADGSAYPRFATNVSGTPLAIPVAATATPGPFTTRLRVIDRAGRVAETESVTFNVVANTPPVIETFVAPDESYAGRTVAVTATAKDDVAVQSLTLTSSAGTVSGFNVSLPPSTPSGTSVTLTLSASDGFPSRAPTTQTRTLTIKKDAIAPAVGITHPTANQQFDEASGGTFLVDVSASDAEVAVQRVTATLDGVTHELQFVNNRWQKQLSIPSVDGTEPVAKTLAVRAYDYEGNFADAQVTFTIKPLVDPNAPALTWSCGSPNAMFPAGYELTLRVNAIPNVPANGVTGVDFAVNDGTPFAATRIGTSDAFEAKYTIPAGTADGTQLDVRVVARSAGGNESTLLGTLTAVSGVTINAASTIAANDTAFEDQSMIVVSGGVLTIAGPHRLRNLVVLGGGKVQQRAVDPLRADELRVERLYVACGGAVDVTGLGLPQRSAYPGAGTPDSGSGGSHIGRGATWTRATGGVFGSVLEPKEPGGGGNSPYSGEGAGGGMVRIRASASVLVDGAVRANGYGSALGGGSGGSVWIITPFLGGSGAIEAIGTINGYGAGGGGAIALEYASSSGTWSVDARGGTTNNDAARTSAPGTIVRNGALLVDGKGLALSNTAVTELPSFGHATAAAVDGTSVTLAEKRWVSPSLAGHRLRAFAPDGTTRGTYRLGSVTRHPSIVTLDGWTLVQTQDATDYDGYLMYTPAGLNGKQWVAVRRLGNDWQYDNDSTFVTFVPTPGDTLFAAFSKSGNRFRSVEPLPCCAAVNGIAVAELVAGELVPDANTPNPNEGLTIFDAGELFLRPDAQHRAFTLSAGAATLTLEKLSGADVQPGDRLRGVHQFSSIEVKDARVVTEDLVEGEGSASVRGGNLSAPLIDASKTSIALGLNGPVLVGAAGAIVDSDGPLEVAARNGNHALPLPTILRGDDFLGYGTTGGFSVVHQQNARSGSGSAAALKSISEGYLSFSPGQTDQPMQAGLSSYEFRLRADATYEVWANSTFANKSGAYATNTAFRIEKSATVLRWFVDNVQVHEVTASVPASVTFEVSMTQATRGELASIEYASALPARSLHAKVAADGSFRVVVEAPAGGTVTVVATDAA
ncbi:MAG TPA: Ig-like domain-containing protein, partial [Thermoanaerobaculia bacterium]